MRRGELRRAMRQERRAISRSLRQLREEARAELRRDPVLRRARGRRRIRRGLLAAAVLVVALLFHCRCEEPPQTPPNASVGPHPVAPPKPKPVAEPRPPPLHAHVKRQPRAHFANPSPTSPAWLDAFQLQVSARSPRLAACFTGADRPGALRWTASLDPRSGTASDHAFEPVGTTADLTPAQKACAVRVLSSPAYKLADTAPRGLPARIALVIAF